MNPTDTNQRLHTPRLDSKNEHLVQLVIRGIWICREKGVQYISHGDSEIYAIGKYLFVMGYRETAAPKPDDRFDIVNA